MLITCRIVWNEGGMNLEIITMVLALTLVGVCVIYSIVKIAVKQAIRESLEDIRGTLSQSIGQSRNEPGVKPLK